MASEEASQLVILGNGFDLHFKQKTGFKDYIETFLINSTMLGKLNDKFDKKLNTPEYLQFCGSSGFNEDENVKKVLFGMFKKDLDEDAKKLNINQKKLLIFYFQARIRTLMEDRVKSNERAKSLIEGRSKTSDFNKIENNFISEILGNLVDKVDLKQKVNFWDIFFLYLHFIERKLSNWSDVEGQILKFFNDTTKTNLNYKKVEEAYYVFYENIDPGDDDSDIYDSDRYKVVITICKLLGERFKTRNLRVLFYTELIKFSKNFSNYLKIQFNKDAQDEEGNSISEFINEKIADGQKYELLNFNYTNIEDSNCTNQVHIHGELNSNDNPPIIGININRLKNNEQHAFKLTKQYQLISSRRSVDNLELHGIKRIVFYGHSLALADYQYFKSIFDRVNLINSSVELVFKYSIYNEKKKEEILKENYDRIFKLLKRYGDDVNIDVITTLMLDGRIKLQEI